MLQLIAQGPELRQRWRQTLHPKKHYLLGRSLDADMPVPWESHLSRHHADVVSIGDRVDLKRLPEARNPIFIDGQAVESGALRRNDQFVIGSTRFTVVEAEASHSPVENPIEEVTFTRQQLQDVRFDDADRRIDVLSHLADVIGQARTEAEMFSRLTNLLLTGVRHAEAVAVVKLDSAGAVTVAYWERRRETEGMFRPSSRLIKESLHHAKRTVLHVWEANEPSREAAENYTVTGEFDWAFCTPVVADGPQRWGVYVAGALDVGSLGPAGAPYLHADVKFAEIVAEIINAVQRASDLEGNLSVLRQFLAPPILAALERSAGGRGLDTDLLEPRECDVTVMFCDLRGFSHQAEESAGDLKGLLSRVSAALEIMTQQILACGGVTGDFLGDAALGFWGWPFASEESPLNACRAALAIRRAFTEIQRQPKHPLANFEIGIGVAHGRAVAGKIGTRDMVKVTVFGPVVNLASRLEGMTKQLRVPVLLDERTADIARERLDVKEGRVRRLGKILPYGMETPVLVTELVPPLSEAPQLTDDQLRLYEQGVDHFIAGRWEEAHRCLHAMPPSDHAQDFLTIRIAQHSRTAPRDWDGVIRLPSK